MPCVNTTCMQPLASLAVACVMRGSDLAAACGPCSHICCVCNKVLPLHLQAVPAITQCCQCVPWWRWCVTVSRLEPVLKPLASCFSLATVFATYNCRKHRTALIVCGCWQSDCQWLCCSRYALPAACLLWCYVVLMPPRGSPGLVWSGPAL